MIFALICRNPPLNRGGFPFWTLHSPRFGGVFRAADRDLIKCRVVQIDIFRVHLFFAQAQALTKALEVYDLTFTQKTDDVVYIGVVTQTENIVVGFAGLLLCCKGNETTI